MSISTLPLALSRGSLSLHSVCCERLALVDRFTEEYRNSMIPFIHNSRLLAKGMEFPDCPEIPPDMVRIIPPLMEGQAHDPLLAELLIAEGGDDNGDDGDNHGVFPAIGHGGFGVNRMDPGAIVDGVLAELPEPARHHILPELEEYHAEGLSSAF